MLETMKEIALTLVLAGVCGIVAYLAKSNKQRVLQVVTDLVQKAESTIQGSGMGAEKKAKVVAQLEAMGITVNEKLSASIDKIVAFLNEKSGWLVESASDTAKDAIDDATEKATT